MATEGKATRKALLNLVRRLDSILREGTGGGSDLCDNWVRSGKGPHSAADVDWGGAEVALNQFLFQELLPLPLPHGLLELSQAGTRTRQPGLRAPFHLDPLRSTPLLHSGTHSNPLHSFPAPPVLPRPPSCHLSDVSLARPQLMVLS